MSMRSARVMTDEGFEGATSDPVLLPVTPIHSYVLKIASRCNLNCSYCFVYNAADQSWKQQPKKMSLDVVRQIALRVRQHAERYGMDSVSIILHGGEPLLAGRDHLDTIFEEFEQCFADSTVTLGFGMQSNGLLFSPEIGDVLLKHGATIGISLDGPPEINDRYRVTLRGRPSGSALENRLRMLCSEHYRPVFSGFLCVVHVEADPVAILSYLAGFAPPGLDFILPYDNHDHLPPGKADFEDTTYGQWLIRLFDYWYDNMPQVRVRIFDSLLRIFLGGSPMVESLGLGPVDLIVVETNGDIEAVDSLKAAYDGATKLGYNVFTDDFDAALAHDAIARRQAGADGLCATCQACPVVEFCGGGYLPNRYATANGYDNPSVFCRDLELLIRHVHQRIRPTLSSLGLIS
jgi:uncharacterized protein